MFIEFEKRLNCTKLVCRLIRGTRGHALPLQQQKTLLKKIIFYNVFDVFNGIFSVL